MSYVESNFFALTKDDELDKVKSRIYGFQLKSGCDIIGHYIEINSAEDSINISVDRQGMGILYEYRYGDFWAVSNSILYLVDIIKKKKKTLTINQDYLNLFAKINSITTVSYSETLFKEIEVVPANHKIVIEKSSKNLIHRDHKEANHLIMGSAQCFEYIDRWANKWISIIRYLFETESQINIQLSGGFDSRLILALILASKIDLSKVNIESSRSMPEDLSIAEEIAKFYGFKVNNGILNTYPSKLISRDEQYKMNMYFRGGVHKEFLPPTHHRFYTKPLFIFTGYGNMRGWFNDTPAKYIQFLIKNKYFSDEEIDSSLQRIIDRIVDSVDRRMNFDIKKGKNFMNFVYNYTRGRYNYGTSVMASATVNQFILSPILDLECINPTSKMYGEDFNLLFAYIYERFSPGLLNFRFSGKRNISKETLEIAKRLNRQKKFNRNDSTTIESFNFQINKYNDKSNQIGNELKERILERVDVSQHDELYRYIGSRYVNAAKEELNSKARHNEKSLFCLHSIAELIGGGLFQAFDANKIISKEELKKLLSTEPVQLELTKLSTFHKGRISVKVKQFTFELALLKSLTKRLYVFLSAVGTSNAPYPLFHRVTWAKNFDGICLYIDDPTRLLTNKFAPTFYFGTRDNDAAKELLEIIKRVQKLYSIENENVSFISSSNGGFASIYISNLLPKSKCIALNPQIAIPYFSKNRNLSIDKELSISFDDRNIFGRIYLFHIIRSTSTKFFLFFNLACNFDKEQYMLFCIKNNILARKDPGIHIISRNITILLVNIPYLNNPHQVQLEENTCRYIDRLLDSNKFKENDPIFDFIINITKKIFELDAQLRQIKQ